MIYEKYNINFHKLRLNMVEGYEEIKACPKLVCGSPCLYKDTAQLNAFEDQFTLGKTATSINQNFPKFIYKKIQINSKIN